MPRRLLIDTHSLFMRAIEQMTELKRLETVAVEARFLYKDIAYALAEAHIKSLPETELPAACVASECTLQDLIAAHVWPRKPVGLWRQSDMMLMFYVVDATLSADGPAGCANPVVVELMRRIERMCAKRAGETRKARYRALQALFRIHCRDLNWLSAAVDARVRFPPQPTSFMLEAPSWLAVKRTGHVAVQVVHPRRARSTQARTRHA